MDDLADTHRADDLGTDEWALWSDERLIAEVGSNPRAFGELYERHAPGLFRYLRSRCRDSQEALDLLAETFAEALAGLDRFDPERGQVGAWLFGIARNKFRRYIRTGAIDERARTRLGVRTMTMNDDALSRIDEIVDVEKSLQRLSGAIDQLPARLAAAISLRYLEDLSYAEISERLGITEEAARKRTARGLLKLSRTLRTNPFGMEP
ncbi:MAG: RNA polymerase sigma factor [Acidimicrobiales bacterium]